MSRKIGDKKCNYCEACYKTTNHTIKAVEKVDGSEDYRQSNFYLIVKCDGCNNISYRTEYVDYEQMTDEGYGDWHPAVTIDTYPKVLRFHKGLSERYYLPKDIAIIYKEAIEAFASECYLLTAVAFRAIIEAICKDKSISGNDLSVKINRMVKKGLITQNESARLHAVRFLGNDSIHEMTVPKPNQLLIILKIVEHLLNNLYIISKEVNSNLEYVIEDFASFKKLLSFHIADLKIGDSFSLRKILGKSLRRLNDKLLEFETNLLKSIESGDYRKLSKGELVSNADQKKDKVQYYTICNNVIDDDDYIL